MATAELTADPASALAKRGSAASMWLPAYSLWWREIKRFYRQRSRVVGVLLSPLVFWLLLGAGFGTSFHAGASQQTYTQYFFPGALIMIVLFTSIFTMMSVIEDRKEGFLLGVMVAPIHRSAIVLGKVLGGTTLAALQGLVFLIFSPFIGIHFGFTAFAMVLLVVFLVAFALTSLGFAIAWSMDSPQAFHAVVNLFLIPLWLLSGALFPLASASGWIRLLMLANPLTYGVDVLRVELFPASVPAMPVPMQLLILGGFCVAVFAACYVVANRRSTTPAA